MTEVLGQVVDPNQAVAPVADPNGQPAGAPTVVADPAPTAEEYAALQEKYNKTVNYNRAVTGRLSQVDPNYTRFRDQLNRSPKVDPGYQEQPFAGNQPQGFQPTSQTPSTTVPTSQPPKFTDENGYVIPEKMVEYQQWVAQEAVKQARQAAITASTEGVERYQMAQEIENDKMVGNDEWLSFAGQVGVTKAEEDAALAFCASVGFDPRNKAAEAAIPGFYQRMAKLARTFIELQRSGEVLQKAPKPNAPASNGAPTPQMPVNPANPMGAGAPNVLQPLQQRAKELADLIAPDDVPL